MDINNIKNLINYFRYTIESPLLDTKSKDELLKDETIKDRLDLYRHPKTKIKYEILKNTCNFKIDYNIKIIEECVKSIDLELKKSNKTFFNMEANKILTMYNLLNNNYENTIKDLDDKSIERIKDIYQKYNNYSKRNNCYYENKVIYNKLLINELIEPYKKTVNNKKNKSK